MVNVSNLELMLKGNFRLAVEKLVVKKQSFTQLMGANGSGKSSLLKAILDLYPARCGTITINGKDILVDESWRTQTGVYLSDSYLPGFMNALEYFKFITVIRKLSVGNIEEYMLAQFPQLINADMLNPRKLIRELSTGNQCRVGVIGSLIGNPDLLILDEPFAHMDEHALVQLKDLLENLHKNGKTILITCHDPSVLDGLITDRIFLENGVMIQ